MYIDPEDFYGEDVSGIQIFKQISIGYYERLWEAKSDLIFGAEKFFFIIINIRLVKISCSATTVSRVS